MPTELSSFHTAKSETFSSMKDRVVVVDVLEGRLAKAKSLGADAVINASCEDVTKAAHKITNGRGFTAIIDATGNPHAIEGAVDIAAPAGRIGLVGLCGSKRVHLDVDTVVTKDVQLIGTVGSPGVWEPVIELCQSGRMNTRALITHRLPLQDLQKAFQLMENRDESTGKIVIDIVQESH
ncbi:zinc-binding dehydrogenase [Alicyclobacillus tolerans]|uniref:zinc-dependent alcohol dehydrogenase n=1 Tax=Alicyclobacillus tolerans TaxID=90970 RepID=UPI001F34C35A|nr:zinc-binding dehydrogenase [Alicyclobacillus tolerans]MCF8566836.1 zinc-binding dehydrogenase [Alicyclobacillus tolerans]